MIKKLLKFVEIQTKITSFFAFLLMLGMMLYHQIPIRVFETVVFFGGMLIFDLTTTAINNTLDPNTNEKVLGFSFKWAKTLCFVLLAISICFGIWLVVLTDWIVLLLGMICFGVGVFYTYGPVPISGTPLGELLSGILFGYFIPFIMLYISTREQLLYISLGEYIALAVNTRLFIGFIIVGLVPTLLTANIMLGNNICDVEEDVKVNRFTLPYYIGKPWACVLMRCLYVLVFIGILVGVVLGVYHPIVLITLVGFPIVMSNVNTFKKEMIKKVSFVNVIKSYITVMVLLNFLVYLSLVF